MNEDKKKISIVLIALIFLVFIAIHDIKIAIKYPQCIFSSDITICSKILKMEEKANGNNMPPMRNNL